MRCGRCNTFVDEQAHHCWRCKTTIEVDPDPEDAPRGEHVARAPSPWVADRLYAEQQATWNPRRSANTTRIFSGLAAVGVVAIALVATGLVGFHSGRTELAAYASGADPGVPYASAEGHFSASFPAAPHDEVVQIDFAGTGSALHTVSADSDSQHTFSITYVVDPIDVGDGQDATKVMDAEVQRVLDKGATGLQMTDTMYGFVSARDVRCRMLGRYDHALLFVVNDRLFSIDVTSDRNADEGFTMFRDSFRVLP